MTMGLGLSLTVAPLTATALGSLDERHAGIASGVNNAVARAASLLAVAVLPLAAGLGPGGLTDSAVLAPTYRTAMWLCAGLLLAGAMTAFAGIPSGTLGTVERRAARPEAPRAPALRASPVRIYCPIAAPPLQPRPGLGEARPG